MTRTSVVLTGSRVAHAGGSLVQIGSFVQTGARAVSSIDGLVPIADTLVPTAGGIVRTAG